MNQTRYIVAGRFIDGSGSGGARTVYLAVQDGIISAIGPVADLPHPGDAAIIDLSHCTILPALVDCSICLARSPSVDNKVRLSSGKADLGQKATMLARHIQYCHAHGVLGVANSDDIADLQAYIQEETGQENIIAIRTSSQSCRSDHCPSATTNGDFLKIAYSTNIEDDAVADPRLKLAELSRILQHRGTRKAVVIANGQQQVEEALAAGCDAIEQGYGMGEANLMEMAKRNVLWIPNVLRAKNALDGAGTGGDVCCRFSHRYVAPGKAIPGAEAFWQKMLTEQLSQLCLARKIGITTAVGTGAGSIGILHGESMAEEMKLFIKAGYTLPETIRCASENGAKFFAMEKLGPLSVGRPATFIFTRGTVQQLPRKLSYLEGIYIDGVPSRNYRKNPTKATT